MKSDLKHKIEHIKIKDNSFLIVKVGSESRPATKEDLKQTQEAFKEALGDDLPDLPVVVTHHSMDVKPYTKMKSDLEKVLSLLSGNLNYDQITEAKQLVKELISSEHPSSTVSLATRTRMQSLLMQLHDKGVISPKTLIEELGLDYDEERARLRDTKEETKNQYQEQKYQEKRSISSELRTQLHDKSIISTNTLIAEFWYKQVLIQANLKLLTGEEFRGEITNYNDKGLIVDKNDQTLVLPWKALDMESAYRIHRELLIKERGGIEKLTLEDTKWLDRKYPAFNVLADDIPS